MVRARAVEAAPDPAELRSNTFRMEWPPRSGRMQDIPEVDRAAWFDPTTARGKIHKGQVRLIDEFEERLDAAPD